MNSEMKRIRSADMFCAGAICAVIVLLLLLCGCTVTRLESREGGGFTFRRVSVMQRTEVPKVSFGADGKTVVSLEGYQNDGGAAIVGAAVEKAVSAAIKSAK